MTTHESFEWDQDVATPAITPETPIDVDNAEQQLRKAACLAERACVLLRNTEVDPNLSCLQCATTEEV